MVKQLVKALKGGNQAGTQEAQLLSQHLLQGSAGRHWGQVGGLKGRVLRLSLGRRPEGQGA